MAENTPEKKETKKNGRIPSAKKRDMQSEKNRLRNKAYRSSMKTVMKDYTENLKTESASKKLSALYSLVDKGVKKGIIKANKAARIKSRMTKKQKRA